MILDLIFVFLFLLCIWAGARRGLVRSALGVVSWFAGILAAIYFYQPFVNFLQSMPAAAVWMEQAKAAIANAVSPFLAQFGLGTREMAEGAAQVPMFLKPLLTDEILTQGNEMVAGVVAEAIFSLGLTVVFILMVKLAVAILIQVMGVVTKIPGLKQMNALLGGLLGAVSGILVCILAAAVVVVIAGNQPEGWLSGQLAQGWLTRYLVDTNFLMKLAVR